MTLDNVWIATKRLADAWEVTDRVATLNRLTRETPGNATRLGRMLQDMGSGFGSISSQPLALATNVRLGLSLGHREDLEIQTQEMNEFLELAGFVEMAHRRTVAWIRSRIPGYPLIGVPQFAPGSSLTTKEFGYRYPWSHEDLASGLQYLDSVPEIDHLLGASAGMNLRTLNSDVATALMQTKEWQDFSNSRDALTRPAKEALKQARADLKKRVSAEHIDAHEPRGALRRNEFRVYHTQQVVAELDGLAGDYARTFQALDDLIDLTVVHVFAQLVRTEDTPALKPLELEFDCSGDGRVSMELEEDLTTIMLKPGRVVRLLHPLIDDLVLTDSVGFSFSDDHGRIRMSGSLLADTACLIADERRDG